MACKLKWRRQIKERLTNACRVSWLSRCQRRYTDLAWYWYMDNSKSRHSLVLRPLLEPYVLDQHVDTKNSKQANRDFPKRQHFWGMRTLRNMQEKWKDYQSALIIEGGSVEPGEPVSVKNRMLFVCHALLPIWNPEVFAVIVSTRHWLVRESTHFEWPVAKSFGTWNIVDWCVSNTTNILCGIYIAPWKNSTTALEL